MTHEFWNHCNIYCINLKKRTDRKAHAEQEFRKLGILDRVHFFYALEKSSPVESLFTTVLKILEPETTRPIVIFEDDFIVDDTKIHYLDKLMPFIQQDSWDLIRLGYRSGRFIEQLSDDIFRGICHSTLVTVYSPSFISSFKSTNFYNLQGLDLHIDRYLKKITNNSLMPYNPIFVPAKLG